MKKIENNVARPSKLQDLPQRLECIENSVAVSVSPSSRAMGPAFLRSMPEFTGDDYEEDAAIWCNEVEELTKDIPRQRLNLAVRELSGSARRWYQTWNANPYTWKKFREDFCAAFLAKSKLHERMVRALRYTSDSATSYTSYARNKLMYLKQTQVAFSSEQQVELIVSSIIDANVRQAMRNGRYEKSADLLVALAGYKKRAAQLEGNPDAEEVSSSKRYY